MYMSLRRERSHKCGHSNIDYRTKNDQESIKTFMPWRSKKEFGTMGNESYKLPFNENKKLLKVTENINTQKNNLFEVPDPKYYKSAQFYNANNIPIKLKTLFTDERVAQLDESFKGKEKFIGDSMMIADLTKNRKLQMEYDQMKKKKVLNSLDIDDDEVSNIEDSKKKKCTEIKKEQIINDKQKKNKSSYHETQIQNIDAKETLDNQVDLNKIKEIRLALRRRYVPRSNIRRIFKEWDKTNHGEISINDAYKMINKLSIPINIDETRALISSSNKRGTETLDLQEFLHLIFNDNDELNLKVSEISNKEDRFHKDGEKLDVFKKNMGKKISESSQKDHEKYLMEYLRLIIPKLAKKFNLNSEDKLHCNYNIFKSVLGNFQIPQKYIDDNIIYSIFEKFAVNGESKNGNFVNTDENSKEPENKMNYRNFINYVIENQETNDFFDYKKKFMNNIENKINALNGKIQEKSDALKHASENKKGFAESLRKEIEDKLNFKDNNNYLDDKITNRTTLVSKFEKEINGAQPSLANVHKFFKDKEIFSVKKTQIENSLSANPQFFSKEKAKTRFGANPPHKNTFYIISHQKESAGFIDEKKRFDVRGKWEVDFQVEEKNKRNIIENKVFERKRKINEMLSQRVQASENYHDQIDNLGQLVRSQKVYRYEDKNKLRSEMIE